MTTQTPELIGLPKIPKGWLTNAELWAAGVPEKPRSKSWWRGKRGEMRRWQVTFLGGFSVRQHSSDMLTKKGEAPDALVQYARGVWLRVHTEHDTPQRYTLSDGSHRLTRYRPIPEIVAIEEIPAALHDDAPDVERLPSVVNPDATAIAREGLIIRATRAVASCEARLANLCNDDTLKDALAFWTEELTEQLSRHRANLDALLADDPGPLVELECELVATVELEPVAVSPEPAIPAESEIDTLLAELQPAPVPEPVTAEPELAPQTNWRDLRRAAQAEWARLDAEDEAAALAADPDARAPWQMTADELCRSDLYHFVRAAGRRVISGLMIAGTIYPLAPGEQRYGKLTRHSDDIVRRIHRSIVVGQHKGWQNGQLPNATPWERRMKPVPRHVLAEYGLAEPEPAMEAPHRLAPTTATPASPRLVPTATINRPCDQILPLYRLAWLLPARPWLASPPELGWPPWHSPWLERKNSVTLIFLLRLKQRHAMFLSSRAARAPPSRRDRDGHLPPQHSQHSQPHRQRQADLLGQGL